MNVSVSLQAFMFLGMVLCGAMCGVVFDVFRALRRYRRPARSIVALQDILFWLIELTVVYMAVFRLNYANIRAYEGIALVIGSWVYFMTVSEYVIRFLCAIISFAVRTAGIVLKPFLLFGRIVSHALSSCCVSIRTRFGCLRLIWRKVCFCFTPFRQFFTSKVDCIRHRITSFFTHKTKRTKKV